MRPFTFINIAASADGKISDQNRMQVKISCDEDATRVDRLRSSSDGIMVGIGTVLSDNPRLTVKSAKFRQERASHGKSPNPFRIIVDSTCRVPPDSQVLDNNAPTIVAVSERAEKRKIDKISSIAEVLITGKERVDLTALAARLFEMGIGKLMVEGGGTLNHGLLWEGLVDEVIVYYGSVIIGDGPTPVDGKSFDPPLQLELRDVERIGEGVVVKWSCL